MADFEYFRAEESDQFSFFRIPKALFTEKEFASLSTDAKLLYGILLDRISLSKKNGWIDGDGYVYIIYTIAELQELLRMSHTTVTKLLYELDSVHGIGLIERYRQGNNRPSVIYVKNFVKRIRGKPVRYFASGTPETGNPDCSLRKMYTAFINSGCQVYFIKFSFFRHHFLQITVWIFLGVAVTVIMSIVIKIMLNFIADRSAKLTCKCCNDHKADQKLSKLPFLFYRSAALLH